MPVSLSPFQVVDLRKQRNVINPASPVVKTNRFYMQLSFIHNHDVYDFTSRYVFSSRLKISLRSEYACYFDENRWEGVGNGGNYRRLDLDLTFNFKSPVCWTLPWLSYPTMHPSTHHPLRPSTLPKPYIQHPIINIWALLNVNPSRVTLSLINSSQPSAPSEAGWKNARGGGCTRFRSGTLISNKRNMR